MAAEHTAVMASYKLSPAYRLGLAGIWVEQFTEHSVDQL